MTKFVTLEEVMEEAIKLSTLLERDGRTKVSHLFALRQMLTAKYPLKAVNLVMKELGEKQQL